MYAIWCCATSVSYSGQTSTAAFNVMSYCRRAACGVDPAGDLTATLTSALSVSP